MFRTETQGMYTVRPFKEVTVMAAVWGRRSALLGRVTYFTVCPQRSIRGVWIFFLLIKALDGLENVLSRVIHTGHHTGPACPTETTVVGDNRICHVVTEL